MAIIIPIVIYCGWMILMVMVSNMAPPSVSELFFYAVVFLFGVALFSLTVVAWGCALKRRLLSVGHALLAAGFLCLILALTSWQFAGGKPAGLHFFVLILGLLSLTVFPFAGAPIALAWNRTR
jgi:hypothetical protein